MFFEKHGTRIKKNLTDPFTIRLELRTFELVRFGRSDRIRVSLRLGHLAALTCHWHVIHSRSAVRLWLTTYGIVLPSTRATGLRHTFATMALENGMDIKTLSAMIGHISAETTLNIYSHITDTMQQQAAVRIDREIGGTNAEMPEPKPPKASEPTPTKSTPEKEFEPYKGKIRKSGTGCVTMINDYLYEGRFTPRVNGKRISKNVYAKTREECEEKLAELIKTMKAEIAAEKKKAKQA